MIYVMIYDIYYNIYVIYNYNNNQLNIYIHVILYNDLFTLIYFRIKIYWRKSINVIA